MSDINLFLIWFLVGAIICVGSYFLPLFKAQRKISKAWDEQNKMFAQLKENFEKTKSDFAQQKITELNKISERKTEAFREYQKALEAIKTAEKIRENTQAQLATLQQRINQLQSELYHARKRAERLASKTKKAENNSNQFLE